MTEPLDPNVWGGVFTSEQPADWFAADLMAGFRRDMVRVKAPKAVPFMDPAWVPGPAQELAREPEDRWTRIKRHVAFGAMTLGFCVSLLIAAWAGVELILLSVRLVVELALWASSVWPSWLTLPVASQAGLVVIVAVFAWMRWKR